MRLRLLLLLALAACSPSRPEGAYTPKSAPIFMGGDDDDGDDEPPTPDAMVEPPAPDAGPVIVDPTNPLSALVGRYYMRMDYFSTATATDSGSTLEVQNRLSNLFLTELKLVDGKLVGTEQLCFQDYNHACVRGCESWTTVVDNRLPKNFFSKRALTREYTVDAAGNLSVPTSSLPLGYDDAAPSAATMPTSTSAPSVWRLGAADDDATSAVLTRVTAGLKTSAIVPLRATLDCFVNVVQLFVTGFSGKLDLAAGADALPQLTLPIAADGSDLRAIYVSAGDQNTAGSFCTMEKLGKGSSDAPKGFVSFRSAAGVTACPGSASAYNKAFPLTVTAP